MDSSELCSIYNYYIENTCITFEEELLDEAAMRERLLAISADYPYLVWEDTAPGGHGAINGYAYLNRFRERSAYRHTAEVSIYLRDGFSGRGMGTKLMEGLLREVLSCDIHALVAGITLPNERSVALHEKFGFRKAALLEEVGYKFGQWLSVGYWVLLPHKGDL